MEIEREAVGRAVEAVAVATGIRAERVLSMAQSPRTWIQQAIQTCNIYLGVYSHRYGWIVPEESISATELEFDLAHQLRKPILIWVRKLRESEKDLPYFDRQEKFLTRATDFSHGYLKQEFSDVEMLERWVADALRETFITIIRQGTTSPGLSLASPTPALLEAYLQEIARQKPYALWSDQSQYIERSVTRIENLFSRTVLKYHPQSSERYEREEPETLDQTLAREDKLILLGEPGLGKTTSLLHLAWQAANDALNSERSIDPHSLGVPIFIELKYYNAEQELEALLAGRVNQVLRPRNLTLSPDSGESTVILKTWLTHPDAKFLLLLDGLNEVNPEYHTLIRDLVQKLFSYKHKFVVACRERDYDSSLRESASAFKLQPLQHNEIQTYLDGVLGPKARPLLNNDILIDSKMVSLAANPLMLWLISVVAQTDPNARLPANKGRLFQQFVFDMPRLRASEGLRSRTSFDAVTAVLAKLGFEMQERRKVTDDLSSARGYLLPIHGQRLEDVLAQAKEWRFLRSDGAMGEQIEFLHQLFLEYFATAHLDSQLRAGHSFAEVICDRHDNEWWGEVITMLAGISNRSAEMVVWLSLECVSKNRANILWLAMRCLETSAALDDESACKSIAEAVAFHVGHWKTRAYGNQRIVDAIGKFAVEPLIRAFRDGNADVRSGVVQWLVKIGKPAVDILLPRLKDKDPELRLLAADALGDIRDGRAIKPLIAALNDPDIRSSVSIALTKHGVAAAKPLRGLLESQDARLRRIAGEILGKLAIPEAIEPLVESLQDEDSSVRWMAAKGLGEITNWRGARRYRPRAVAVLDNILRSNDPDDREFAAFALGKVGGVRACDPLLRALKDQSPEVRYRAITALEEIHRKTDMLRFCEPVIATLNDDSAIVSCKAAHLLEQYGYDAIRALVMALRHKDENVRSHALVLLTKSTFGVKASILALKDTSETVRRLATVFLWQQANAHTLDSLVGALTDEDEAVRTIAVDALGKIKDGRAVEPLIARLNDQSGKVRSLAAFALNKIGDQQAVEPLMTALRDREPEVRWFAVDALCQIGDRRALNELRRVAREDDTQTRFGNVGKAARNAVRRILLSPMNQPA
jgi:HEAT repeat protein